MCLLSASSTLKTQPARGMAMHTQNSRLPVKQRTKPAFLRLPAEILSILVQEFVELHRDVDCGESTALKILRRVHLRFAYLRSLCKWLFRFVVVSPDPSREWLHDWSYIGSYVKEVYLEPVALIDPDLPWQPQEARRVARDAIAPYHQYIEGGAAEIALVNTFHALPNLCEVTILSNLKDSEIMLPAANNFITFTTKCLRRAGITLKELKLINTGIRELWNMDQLARWVGSPFDEQLDLSELKKLSFELQNSGRSDDDESNERSFETIARALCNILVQCKDSVKEVSIATHTGVIWHPNVLAPRMTKLSCIRLSDCKIEAISLGTWLLACDSLMELYLTDVSLRDNVPQDGLRLWQPVFQAVRHHPRRLFLGVHGVEVNYHYTSRWDDDFDVMELRYSQNTSLSEPLEVEPGLHLDYYAIIAMLVSYTSRQGDWQLLDGW